MEAYVNEWNKKCYRGATRDSIFDVDLFNVVSDHREEFDGEYQRALHTDIGSITVLDRRTGFGWRDVETGYRDVNGNFWLASGNRDVTKSDCKTLGEAIDWVKRYANTCVPKEV